MMLKRSWGFWGGIEGEKGVISRLGFTQLMFFPTSERGNHEGACEPNSRCMTAVNRHDYRIDVDKLVKSGRQSM